MEGSKTFKNHAQKLQQQSRARRLRALRRARREVLTQVALDPAMPALERLRAMRELDKLDKAEDWKPRSYTPEQRARMAARRLERQGKLPAPEQRPPGTRCWRLTGTNLYYDERGKLVDPAGLEVAGEVDLVGACKLAVDGVKSVR
jgi:hypothetical protein